LFGLFAVAWQTDFEATVRVCIVHLCGTVMSRVCGMLQVFGLGNKTYENFNSMGKFVDHRLEELGASRVFELGLGDDDAK